MRRTTTIFLAIAALSGFEAAGTGTPFATVQSAQAEALPSVWQNKAKKLAQNIEKFRAGLASKGAADLADDFKKKQMLDRIANFEATLKKIPEADDPNLNAAKEQFALLQKEFAALSGGAAAAPAQPAASGSTAATNGTITTPAPSADEPQLVSGQRVRVKKLTTDMTNVMGDIVVTGASPMQSGEVVGKYNKRLQQFADALGRYAPYKNDPDVRTAAQTYQALVAAITGEYKRAEAQKAALGDVPARLGKVEAALTANPPPGAIFPPFTVDMAKTWAGQAADAKQAALAGIEEIRRIEPTSYLYRGDLTRLYGHATQAVTDVDEAFETSARTLKERFDFQDQHGLTFLRELDPENEHHVANSYLQEGAEERIYGFLDKEMALAQSIAAFQIGLGKEPTANTTARIEEITALRKKYVDGRTKVLGDSKLPEPASTDADRLAIAEKILANPEYEFGEHGPVVLTTPEIVTREKEVSRDTIKDVDVSLSGTITLSGTRESWKYKWDEFKFATPLKDESGDWYIWWITAKKYESGWERTPIGMWVSGSTVKGSLILPENF